VSAKRVDAHQHFWRYDAAELPWIDDAMALLRRDFLGADLAALLRANGIDACVAVQAPAARAETEFLLAQAERHAIVSAVVGWTDLRAPRIDAELERLRGIEARRLPPHRAGRGGRPPGSRGSSRRARPRLTATCWCARQLPAAQRSRARSRAAHRADRMASRRSRRG
jgi:predicted TIM-barrel fold metal-dependent hydrolase